MDRWSTGRQALVSAYLYVEGGGTGADSKYSRIRCQEGFHKVLERMGFARRKPRLVACGGRGGAYDRFVVGHSKKVAGFFAVGVGREGAAGRPQGGRVQFRK